MEIRTYPDNGAFQGYTGINIDSGEFGIVHNLEKWDHGITTKSIQTIVNRLQIGAMARIESKKGTGLDDNDEMSRSTSNRQASILFDPFDGRAYLFSNDETVYVNNDTRDPETKLPLRTVARIGDIPTKITDLQNDLDFISDPNYQHTDNNFTHSNRFILDNIDDRTFVYPEISKDKSGAYLENSRMGLIGTSNYGESDGDHPYNSQPDFGEDKDTGGSDRAGSSINSYNANKNYSGVNHREGYLPGIFRSLEELERVDLIDQIRVLNVHTASPGGRRPYNYYLFDGIWSPTWLDRYQYNDSYLAQSLHPTNMTILLPEREPVHYSQVSNKDYASKPINIYQWRYNRITLKYYSKDISISIVESGEGYNLGDILRWNFMDDVLHYEVLGVGVNGQIQRGKFLNLKENKVFKADPSSYGVGIAFVNTTGTGRGAELAIDCPVTITSNATQIKNNLYAYVDVVPTVRSDNDTPWSDINPPDSQDGLINVRSTAAYPAFSGVNSGRGGPSPGAGNSKTIFHEHGGNATAGVHVHLFKYVINTQSPTWEVRDGIQVFKGQWVDQGPLGVERPCDIKALLFSNPDTNNFNNYYKFMVDAFFDSVVRSPDGVMSNNPNATTMVRLHISDRDPISTKRFYEEKVDPNTSRIQDVDITDKVLYVNAATGVMFMYNASHKNDPNFGYGNRAPGWFPIAGTVTR